MQKVRSDRNSADLPTQFLTDSETIDDKSQCVATLSVYRSAELELRENKVRRRDNFLRPSKDSVK